jgi:hypothetical protein
MASRWRKDCARVACHRHYLEELVISSRHIPRQRVLDDITPSTELATPHRVVDYCNAFHRHYSL